MGDILENQKHLQLSLYARPLSFPKVTSSTYLKGFWLYDYAQLQEEVCLGDSFFASSLLLLDG